MATPFRTSRRVEFRDTDAAGIAHFSSFFFYMEQAEHDLLRHIGLSVLAQDADDQWISWPRVKAHCDYLGPVKFEDVLDIEVRVDRLGEKSVTYGFDFLLEKKLVARGHLVTVCCRILPDAPPQSLPIPARYREPLRTYLSAPQSAEPPV